MWTAGDASASDSGVSIPCCGLACTRHPSIPLHVTHFAVAAPRPRPHGLHALQSLEYPWRRIVL
jgi:hypothetical protein